MTLVRVEKMFIVGSFHFMTNTHMKMMLPHASYYSLLLLILFLSDSLSKSVFLHEISCPRPLPWKSVFFIRSFIEFFLLLLFVVRHFPLKECFFLFPRFTYFELCLQSCIWVLFQVRL